MANISNEEIVAFSNQMVMILQAGISPNEGFQIIKEDAQNEETAQLFLQMDELAQLGEPFSQVIKESHVFPSYYENMVTIGEQAGRLEEVLASLSQYYQRQNDLSQTIKSALTYPFIMLFMMIAVVIVLVAKVLPIFDQVYQQLGTTVTGFSRSLMNIGMWLSKYSIVIIALILFVILLVIYLLKSKKGKKKLKVILTKLPFSKGIYADMAVSRFAGSLSIALKSGLDIQDSLTLVANIVDHPVISKKVLKCKEMVDQQENFDQAVNQTHLFSGLYARMFAVSVKTGSSDEVMEKIAQGYNEQAENKLENLITIIEPTLVAILAIIVGVILLSVMLPLISIMASL